MDMTGWFLVGLYFFPAIVAACRHHWNQNAIFMLNLFLGWTFIGWVVALVWACTNDRTAKPPSREFIELFKEQPQR
jgi:hypothetical protein